jgi:hypothetical protein
VRKCRQRQLQRDFALRQSEELNRQQQAQMQKQKERDADRNASVREKIKEDFAPVKQLSTQLSPPSVVHHDGTRNPDGTWHQQPWDEVINDGPTGRSTPSLQELQPRPSDPSGNLTKTADYYAAQKAQNQIETFSRSSGIDVTDGNYSVVSRKSMKLRQRCAVADVRFCVRSRSPNSLV